MGQPLPHTKRSFAYCQNVNYLFSKKLVRMQPMKTPIIADRSVPTELPKTDNQRLKELKAMLLSDKGTNVVAKVIDIALDDTHPGQMAALKMCMDRTLPASMFDKEKTQRGSVTINITGIGAPEMKDIIDG
jgi:hypothetical protein